MVTIIKDGSSKAAIRNLLDKLKTKKGFDAKKYSGIIKLKKSPLEIQKIIRNEWS